jgi:putative two-component system response regulator
MRVSPFAAFHPLDFDPIEVLPPLLEAHFPGLGDHSRRTALLAGRLAQKFGLSPAERIALRLGALYHDVGKLLVPVEILAKSGRLLPPELAIVRRHVVHGLRLLRETPIPLPAYDAIAHHHERWDGNGYPLGLAGPRIPLSARLVAVADVYDTLRSQRPYGPVFSRAEALAELRRAAGRQLDPGLVPLAALISED